MQVFEMILSGRSLINSRKNRGPSTEPYGTPLMTSTLSDAHPLTTTLGSAEEERCNPLVGVPSDAVMVQLSE